MMLNAVDTAVDTSTVVNTNSNLAADKVVIILRGLPGSGKSTRSAQIAAEAKRTAAAAAAALLMSDPVVAIHSTDSFFVNSAGRYHFEPSLLSINHQRNLDAFNESLAAGVGIVIVDNTNLQPWQYEKYVRAAWAAGYRVKEEVVGEFTEAAAAEYAARNVHGVSYEKLLVMLDQWRQQD
jgi:nicotinate-nucleotide pyrophosphorylase